MPPDRVQRVVLFLLLLFLPAAALADGIVIPPIAYPDKVTVPDQRALICWSNGVERLAIETHFTGAGSNFAWIVPLPSKPAIEEVTPGLFPTLEFIFRPAITHNVPPLYLVLLVCIGIAYLLLSIRRNTPPRITDTIVSVAVALATLPFSACMAWPLVVLLPYAAWRVRSGKVGPWFILAVFFVIFLMAASLLPALSMAKPIAPVSSVSVLGHETVGEYDITTITAQKPQAMKEWLDNNGYAFPSKADNVISNYLNKHWMFVAIKLRRDSTGYATNMPQPLCFTFHSDTAVYPMQLTGIGSDQLTVELFVFGPSRAEAGFFDTKRCSMPVFIEPNAFSRGSTTELRVAHPLLRNWVAGSLVATRLTATLDPNQMADDINIQWVPFQEIHHDLYSNQGAWLWGLNSGVGVFTIGLLLASIAAAVCRSWRSHLKSLAGLAFVIGAIVTLIFFASVPKTPVRIQRHPTMSSFSNLRSLALLYSMENEANHLASFAESRAALKRIEDENPGLTGQNPLLGGPVREEDSPGNYILRQTTNGVEFVWFDADGGEHLSNEQP